MHNSFKSILALESMLNNFRKYVLASETGYALFYAAIYFLGMTITFGLRLDTAIVNAAFGILGGLWLSKKFHKDNKYLVQKVKEDEYDTVRTYNDLFKRGEIPRTKQEQAKYAEYLEAIEKTNSRSTPKELLSFAFLWVVFALLVLGDGFNVLSILFGAILLFFGYGFIRTKLNLKKISSLRQSMNYGLKKKEKIV